MDLPNTLFIGTIILIALMQVFAVILFMLNLRLNRDLHHLKEQSQNLEDQAQKQTQSAQEEAQKIIKKAHNDAAEIVSNAQVFTERTNELLRQELERIANQQASSYQQIYKEARDTIIKRVFDLAKQLETQTQAEVHQLKSDIQAEALQAQEDTREAIKEVYQQSQKEIEAYKQQQKERLAQVSLEVIQEISKITLQKTITQDEHEALIMKAVNQAYNEKLF